MTVISGRSIHTHAQAHTHTHIITQSNKKKTTGYVTLMGTYIRYVTLMGTYIFMHMRTHPHNTPDQKKTDRLCHSHRHIYTHAHARAHACHIITHRTPKKNGRLCHSWTHACAHIILITHILSHSLAHSLTV